MTLFLNIFLDNFFAYISNTTRKISITPKGSFSAIGIDVGLKDFAILSNGTTYANPKFFRKLEEKLAKAQRTVATKTKTLKSCIA